MTVRDGQHLHRRVNAPDELEGPVAKGERVGSVTVLVDGRRVRRVALVTAEEVPGAGTLRVLLSDVGVPLTVLIAARNPRRRRSRTASTADPDPHRKMIITVTLNAAIDKTLAVPNFRLGRRHRAVEQTAMAGGKGVNVARALRALGQPVIATGVAGGPTGTRIVEHLTEEGILNDFVRIREESRTSTAVVDPTSGEQTEINEHGPHVTEAELELFVDKLLYLGKGAAVCVISGSLPRGVDAGLYGRLIEEMKRLGRDDRARLRGRADEHRHAQGARRRDPERARGRGPRGPRVLRRRGPPDRRGGDDRAGRARGADDPAGRLPRDAARALGRALPSTARRSSRSSRSPRSGRATPSSPASSPPATAGREVEDCLRFAVACGAESTQHFGAGVLEQREVERLVPDVRVEQLETPAVTVG